MACVAGSRKRARRLNHPSPALVSARPQVRKKIGITLTIRAHSRGSVSLGEDEVMGEDYAGSAAATRS